ncbi:transcriptional regulator, AsnC family [Leifsonia sp. 98AMF]|jgi:Lrp/AsnC family transcriptional regulator for asnA, asnC and gidA|uniref:Lrp/AsnC family transcriptional regulator n=1 Tax=Microbacteriaceae TaxID=85023 RepID=UPI00037F88DE|nr:MULTISPECIES: Lrp/AsnC family transcriptional regulator [Microbacteriaceae]TDQ02372.1 AsnC family transcriptional regulator [Leifsonia sp. 115AMFTsu3.1]SDH08318.1 transcriptional regulator, AsnC family [Leifsonia sp. 197AMF]SDJ31525.1 transcriptional regulator, AsnC family [Leifsonia sp. 466MF]SDK48523.1 transcriptional regulator, AsnC family [Leifsonia sp. 157MF]SDN52881.1 transcriptional regulator, AsnC family [Leifsonia sp. 509MF]
MDIDTIDRKIIDQLRVDGRRSFAVIGRNVGLSEPSVRARYRRLSKAGIVQVVGMPDAPKLGEIEVHIAIRIRGVAVAAVAKQLVTVPEIKFVASAVGAYDLIADLRCDDVIHLSSILNEKVRRVNGVQHVETMTVLEVMKDTYLWAGFREDSAPVDEAIIKRRTARPQLPKL